MLIAILGSNSQIARSIRKYFDFHDLRLFCRAMGNYDKFGNEQYDMIINCVGISQPNEQLKHAKDIIKVTEHYDKLVLKYLKTHKNAIYIFTSSGVVHEPDQSAYRDSKLQAEKRHRETDADIIDLRIYSFFSRFSHPNSGMFMDEVIRCMQTGEMLRLCPVPLYRDYVSPGDLADFILNIKPVNRTYEVFSNHTVSTFDIASHFKRYGLKYEEGEVPVNPTGLKEHYYAKRHDGFIPSQTSMESIIEESNFILK